MVGSSYSASYHAHKNPTAMSPTEVTEKLGLTRMKDRSWFCHPSNALAGDGLFEGQSRRASSNSAQSLIIDSKQVCSG